MSRIYVGNVDSRAAERDLEDEFRMYGVLRSVWVARKPPGFAFVEFEDRRDASDAIRALDGKNGWRVELARSSGGGGGGPRGGGSGPRGGGGGGGGGHGGDTKCYECGEAGHFARECHLRAGAGGLGNGPRVRSRSPRSRQSPSYGNRSPGADGRRSRSPAGTRQGMSPERERSLSQSPPPRRQGYRDSSPANGSGKSFRESRPERSVSP